MPELEKWYPKNSVGDIFEIILTFIEKIFENDTKVPILFAKPINPF